MKKLFCLQAKGQYKAHVDAKKARCWDKAIMRRVGLTVSDGSGDKIADEESWVRVHFPWTDFEEGTGRPTRDAEESEEEENDW